jgi:hypothetical protein
MFERNLSTPAPLLERRGGGCARHASVAPVPPSPGPSPGPSVPPSAP